MEWTQYNLNQDITYWRPSAQNEYGHAGSEAPILIKGRWETSTQQIRKPSGEEIISRAEVFVDRDLEISGYLALGDKTGEVTPSSDAQEIQDFRITPDLRNLDAERRAFL